MTAVRTVAVNRRGGIASQSPAALVYEVMVKPAQPDEVVVGRRAAVGEEHDVVNLVDASAAPGEPAVVVTAGDMSA